MLSIGRLGRGNSAHEYYLELREGEYYDRRGSGEPTGHWYGRLCEGFDLSGAVGRDEFCQLLNAESPTTGEPLRRRQSNGRKAFDLTFSAPKDVSVVYALASAGLRRAMDAALCEAARAGLRYIEEEACKTRLGPGGAEVVRGGGLAAALFPHDTSRALDPQNHIHAVTFNFTRGPDGKYRALDASKFYEHAHAGGALFRAELAARLAMLGFEIEADGFGFSIKGVPEGLSEEFSKRAGQIQSEVRGREATPKQKDEANLKTRREKQDVDRDELQREWQEVGRRHGLTAERVSELRTYARPEDWDEARELRAAVREALKQLTSGASSFTERKFLERTAVAA